MSIHKLIVSLSLHNSLIVIQISFTVLLGFTRITPMQKYVWNRLALSILSSYSMAGVRSEIMKKTAGGQSNVCILNDTEWVHTYVG